MQQACLTILTQLIMKHIVLIGVYVKLILFLEVILIRYQEPLLRQIYSDYHQRIWNRKSWLWFQWYFPRRTIKRFQHDGELWFDLEKSALFIWRISSSKTDFEGYKLRAQTNSKGYSFYLTKQSLTQTLIYYPEKS